jgi:flagellar protein FliT
MRNRPMMPPDDGAVGSAGGMRLIERYEQLAQASHEMLAAARHGDWVSVARIEDACRALITELKAHSRHARLGEAEQRRRIALLRAILADDAQIRHRSEPWLQQLEQMLHPSLPERRPSPGA